MSLLYHQNPLYRAMLFRLLRLTTHSYKNLLHLLLLHFDIHLIRSLDASECDDERREALQLICSLLYIYQKSPLKKFLHSPGKESLLKESAFTLFPKSALKSIVEIAMDRLPRMLENLDETKKPDKLSFACLAILVEFAINDPILVLECAGTDWIVRAVVGPGATNQTLATLVCRVLLKWLDTAEIRAKAKLHLVMEQIFAPLIDLGFFHQNQNELPKADQPPMKINQILECVSTIFLSIFRSWTARLHLPDRYKTKRIQYSSKLASGKSYDAQVTFPHSDNAMLLLNRLDQLNDTSFNRLPLESQLHNIELFVCGGKALDLENKNRERSTSQVSPEDRLEHLFSSEPEFFSKVTAKELDLTRLESIVDCLEWDQGSLLTKHRYNDKLHSFYSREVLYKGVFSPKNILNTCAHYYFAVLAAIG
uniref:Rapamycin-insensitive companion of mTOR N-terminal domain-containing protein n=1 Tax=Panagrolaimus sp. ES5 TaxID=591445 RepID=A0AC34FSK9_9BILA